MKITIPQHDAEVPELDARFAELETAVAQLSQRLVTLETAKPPVVDPPVPPVEPPVPPGVSPTVPPVSPPIELPSKHVGMFPTPVFDPNTFVRRPVNAQVVTVSGITGGESEDLSIKLQAAQDLPGNITVRVVGGGSFKNQVHIKHHTMFDSSEYFCDTTGSDVINGTNNSIWYGTFLADDGVLVEGTWRPPDILNEFFKKPSFTLLKQVQALTLEQMAGTGTTIWESAFSVGGQPSVQVFQAYQDAISISHEGESRNITVMGFHIKGRQPISDGGVRQSISFGNCKGGAALYNYLDQTGSIGIQFGGSGHGGKTSSDFLIWRNVTRGLAAAHAAVVNGRDFIVAENYAYQFGRAGFGGGVAGFDLETNDVSDRAHNGWIFGNIYDYEDSFQNGAGNAINMQDPGFNAVRNGDCFAVNNWIIGGREDALHRYMSNGIFIAFLNRVTADNNYIFKTGQSAIQWIGLPLTMTAAQFAALETEQRESFLNFKVYLKDGENWKLNPDREATGKGGVAKNNVFDATGGGGNPSIVLSSTDGVEVARNEFTLRPEIKFSTDSSILDCGTNSKIHDNRQGDKLIMPTACPK